MDMGMDMDMDMDMDMGASHRLSCGVCTACRARLACRSLARSSLRVLSLCIVRCALMRFACIDAMVVTVKTSNHLG
jgi:hypothetical protein